MKSNLPPLVVHVIYALGTGGLENGLVNIINRASPERYRHAIVCLTSADDFAGRLTAPNVRIVELHKKPGHDWGVYRRLWRTLRELKPAIVHTRNLAALEMQAVGLMLPGVRKVHGEHGRDIYDLDGSNRKYQMLRRLLSPFIHRFITVSQDLRQWLVEVVGISSAKVEQIYNGVDPSQFSPGISSHPEGVPENFLPSKATVIGTVGRIAEVKDQLTLLHAFSQLLNDAPGYRDSVRLVIVGDGPLFKKLEQRVADLALQDLVWMSGDRSDVPELLGMMDIFVLPSLAEGISNTILEAMATGLPVVATRTGGNPELVRDGENGYLVPVADPAAMAAALRRLLDEPGDRLAFGEKGRALIDRQFNWDRTVERYLSIYDEVLAAD